MEKSFSTMNNNSYHYSIDNHSFYYVPDHEYPSPKANIALLKFNNKGRYAFRNEKNFIRNVKPAFTASYSSQLLKENLANLRQLLIEVTDACNLSCKYCGYSEFYKNHDERQNKNQIFDNIKLLIDYLTQFWISPLNISYNNTVIIGFYGGEPLINFKLIQEVITYIDTLQLPSMKFIYNMTTNAVLLDKYMDYIVDKEFHLLISLDGNRENDSYRTTKNNKPSFDIVVANTLKLKEKYPDYFEKYVEFNAVLHNRNSVEEIISYIWDTFGKMPTVSELSINEVAENKVGEFWKMFIDKFDSFEQALNCERLQEKLALSSPKSLSLNSFLDAFTNNTYRSYVDMFLSSETCQYIPTGTCSPFSRKIFLTVNGKILPCEKIGQYKALGYVKDGKVDIDFEKISDFYRKKYEQLIHRCSDCLQWKNCGLCIYYMKEKEGKLICPAYRSRAKAAKPYFSEFLSLMENNPTLYKKVLDNLTID